MEEATYLYVFNCCAAQQLIEKIAFLKPPKYLVINMLPPYNQSRAESLLIFFSLLQIRGFLSRFHQLLPASLAFDKCTACSPIVSVRLTQPCLVQSNGVKWLSY